MNYESMLKKLSEYGQEHVLRFYDELNENERKELLSQIDDLDIEYITDIFKTVKSRKAESAKGEITDISSTSLFEMKEEDKVRIWNKGLTALKEGKVAVLMVAGGQGTRLGYNGPKGTFRLDLPHHEAIFEIHAKRMKYMTALCKRDIPWYIMTSPGNNEATVEFFRENSFFGLNESSVHFFMQDTLPSFDVEGRLIMSSKSSISRNPDGGGGCFRVMARYGILDDLKEKGIENIFFCGVDNVLARLCDPFFIGFAIESGKDVSSKSVLKANKEERVGVLANRDGKPSIIEYTEIPEEFLKMGTDDDFPFRSGNILMHIFRLDFIFRTLDKKPEYHEAFKKVPYIDENGQLIKPNEPNAYKFETFYFDLFKYADGMSVLNIKREEEFSPVKNLTGTDSKDSAVKMIKDLHTKWVKDAGLRTDSKIVLPFDSMVYGNELTKDEIEKLL